MYFNNSETVLVNSQSCDIYLSISQKRITSRYFTQLFEQLSKTSNAYRQHLTAFLNGFYNSNDQVIDKKNFSTTDYQRKQSDFEEYRIENTKNIQNQSNEMRNRLLHTFL